MNDSLHIDVRIWQLRNFAASRDWDGSHPRRPEETPFQTVPERQHDTKPKRILVANLTGCQQCGHDALIISIKTSHSVSAMCQRDRSEAYPKSVNPVPATNANEAVNVLPRKDNACRSTSSLRSPLTGWDLPSRCSVRVFSFAFGSTSRAAIRRAISEFRGSAQRREWSRFSRF